MTRNEELKVLTIAADKGGVKKTTTTHNFADWLAFQGYKVLLIDEDRSMNLTRRYVLGEEAPKLSSVLSVYTDSDWQALKVTDNIDLIAASAEIPELEERLKNKIQRELLLFKWIAKNYELLNSNYDYILIDTRNDSGVLTLNALAAADVVIGITDTSVDGYEALGTLKDKVDELNEAYENNAHLVFIVGGILKNEKTTQEILSLLKERQEFLGAFRKNTNMANPETVFEQAQHQPRFAREQASFLSELEALFGKIKEVLDHGE